MAKKKVKSKTMIATKCCKVGTYEGPERGSEDKKDAKVVTYCGYCNAEAETFEMCVQCKGTGVILVREKKHTGSLGKVTGSKPCGSCG